MIESNCSSSWYYESHLFEKTFILLPPSMRRKEILFQHEDLSYTLPYFEYEGNKIWQHLIISGGMHGNEINGIMMCKYIQQHIESHHIEDILIGKITMIPILNPLWFQQMYRYIPSDNKDLNRSFGKAQDKTLSEHYADFLVEQFFQYADHGIDIHDAGWRTILIPHARIHSCTTDHCDITIHNMARRFDSKIIMEREGNPHMLAVYAQDILHKPIMTIEVGGNQVLYKEYFDDTLHGIINVMRWLRYISEKPILHNTVQHFLTDRKTHITRCGWVLSLEVKVWDTVILGQKLGTIYYPLMDTHDDIFSQSDGFVFSIRASEQIPKNEDMISIIR